MKSPRAYARGIPHLLGGFLGRTLIRSASFKESIFYIPLRLDGRELVQRR